MGVTAFEIPAAPQATGSPRTVSLPLFVGLTIAATGGPLALAGLYAPGAVSSRSSFGLVVVLATLGFIAPIAIWCRYSEQVVSSGGLFAFVEAAVGRRLALAQGGVWVISYLLYLPYTITYIVYDELPVILPGVHPYRSLLEVTLPVAVAGLALLRIDRALVIVAGLALGQLAILVVLAFAGLVHLGGSPAGAFAAHGAAGPLLRGSANVSLLYVCASLPLFLGGEVAGGSRTVRRGLTIGFGVAAFSVLVGTLVWAHAGPALLASPIPGVALAQAAVGHGFATIVGLGIVGSVAGVVVAEYFAVCRVLHAMSRRPLARTTAAVAVAFVGADLLSLINPDAFYADLVKPSLVALWVSQFLVFAVYPWFAARRHRLGPGAVGLAAAASALMAYGLYSAATLLTST